MACDTIRQRGQAEQRRRDEIKEALRRLEAALGAGSAKVVIGPSGAITFVGWAGAERDDVSDVCAFRQLTAAGSWELRQAIARAEAQAGRKVNPAAMAAGVHSHDGGKTWGKH